MTNKEYSNKKRTFYVLVFFAISLLLVGVILRLRVGELLTTYTENQTRKQAEAFAKIAEEEFLTEFENLKYVAEKMEANPYNLSTLMPAIYNEKGVQQGLLTIDGNAMYGDDLDPKAFDGIQPSFRGNSAISYVEDEGVLFTYPVYSGKNIRYVLYRLYPPESLEESFSISSYNNRGKFCITTRDGDILVPFYESTPEDLEFYHSDDIQKKYASMHMEMEVSVAVARNFPTSRGDMILFESEIPGTDFLISGYVPRSVASEGIGRISLLVAWVFGLLMILVMIGAFYLTRASIKIKESDELRKAKAEAEEASKAKSDFLANMSHEIRTPINAILGMNEMILRESTDPDIRVYSDNIRVAGDTLLNIINDVLDFSKIESGKVDVVAVEYDLGPMINDLLNLIKNRADEKHLKMIFKIDRSIPRRLIGDEVRIKQIITNLLTNAVKYTEQGSVTFTLSYTDDPEDKDYIDMKVSVKDTGSGIKEEDMDKLFSKFERLEERRNHTIEGTGLGINITESLLKLMGSDLKVESEYGKGSDFSFTLRQKVVSREELGYYERTGDALKALQEQNKGFFTAPSARILVVDDNPMNLAVFKSLVKRLKVQTDSANDGFECIEYSHKNKYDIIFLDHMMPEKDGIETLSDIRRDPEDKNHETPVICLTANAISGAKEEYMRAGFDDYLTKPINSRKLEDMILQYLPDTLIEKNTGTKDSENETEEIPEILSVLKDTSLNTEKGIENSGGVRSFMPLLQMFYETIDEKQGELNGFLSEENYESYTIKIHALKSSLRLIGATELGEKAQELENAGKTGDTAFIKEKHKAFMDEYVSLKEPLSAIFIDEEDEEGKTEADAETMKAAYEKLYRAAEDMDCDELEDVLKSMERFHIPDKEKELYGKVRDAIRQYDYDEILRLLDAE
ncbi:MAG: response regulator [Lachnospiraceae bacterium]|nr:response regulator [Lachnospiraceae bacterium]